MSRKPLAYETPHGIRRASARRGLKGDPSTSGGRGIGESGRASARAQSLKVARMLRLRGRRPGSESLLDEPGKAPERFGRQAPPQPDVPRRERKRTGRPGASPQGMPTGSALASARAQSGVRNGTLRRSGPTSKGGSKAMLRHCRRTAEPDRTGFGLSETAGTRKEPCSGNAPNGKAKALRRRSGTGPARGSRLRLRSRAGPSGKGWSCQPPTGDGKRRKLRLAT